MLESNIESEPKTEVSSVPQSIDLRHYRLPQPSFKQTIKPIGRSSTVLANFQSGSVELESAELQLAAESPRSQLHDMVTYTSKLSRDRFLKLSNSHESFEQSRRSRLDLLKAR